MAKPANEIWREFKTDGVPSSGPYNPPKADIREWGSAVEIFTSSTGSALVYSTRSALYADLAHAANVMAWVVADSTVAYIGVYQKSGSSGSGSWSRVADLPIEVFVATNAGAGTANAIQATTTYPVSSGKLIVLPILAANTSTTVTLALNGGTAYPIKTSSGSNPVVGGIAIGKVILYFDGSTYGLLSDQNVTALETALASHEARPDNPHSVTKTQVGLGNVDNTSDLNKPISTATQAALDAKVTSGGSIGSGATVPTPGSTDDSTKVANTAWVRAYLVSVSSGVITFNGRAGTVTPQSGDYTAAQVGAVPTARTVTAGTGLTGGGALSADITISPSIATQAEAEAGSVSDKLMTPQRTAQAIAALSLSVGWGLIIEDQKSRGTSGGTASTGWQTRTLNTVVRNTIGASLANNVVTLPAGTYEIMADAPAFSAGSHVIRLYDTTASSVLKVGTAERQDYSVQTRSSLTAVITSASTITVRIEHYVENAGAIRLGCPTTQGTEVYTRFFAKKLA